MDYTKYTSRQQNIVNGNIPLWLTTSTEIRRLYAKALFNFDSDIAKFAEKEIIRRQIRHEERKPYSQRQNDIIEGRIPMEDVNKPNLIKLYYAAAYDGDVELGRRIENELRSRGNWIKSINRYTSKQSAIIQDFIDIRTINNIALRWLKRDAIVFGDMDIVDWVCDEEKSRGQGESNAERDEILDINRYNELKDYQLNYLLHLSNKSGDKETLEKIYTELKCRFYDLRKPHYSMIESEFIEGARSIESISTWNLEELSQKLSLDDTNDYSVLKELLEAGVITQDEFDTKRSQMFHENEKDGASLGRTSGIDFDALKSLEELKNKGIITQNEYAQKVAQICGLDDSNISKNRMHPQKNKSQDVRPNVTKITGSLDGIKSNTNKAGLTHFDALKKAQSNSSFVGAGKTFNNKPKQISSVGRTSIGFMILIAAIIIIAVVYGDSFSNSSSDPVKYTKSATEGQVVYAEITSIEPHYGVYRDNKNYMQDYTDVVCKCNSSENETIWMVIPYETYIEKIDPSAENSSLNRGKDFVNSTLEAPKKVLLGSPRKMIGEIEKADNIADDIGSEVGELVMVYDDYLN